MKIMPMDICALGNQNKWLAVKCLLKVENIAILLFQETMGREDSLVGYLRIFLKG
jgi:hypothetical protein